MIKMKIFSYQFLKNSHQKIADKATDSFNIRIHRALKWYARSEKESGDIDAEFIFLWISFNAAYAQEFGAEHSERANFTKFLKLVLKGDKNAKIHQILFKNFTGSIRTLIENKFVYEGFWQALRTHDSSGDWERSFEQSKKKAMTALLDKDILTVLSVIFDRLYVLRNQLIHGGSTWNSQVNRQQVVDGCKILRELAPVIFGLMIEQYQEDFGALVYPVIN